MKIFPVIGLIINWYKIYLYFTVKIKYINLIDSFFFLYQWIIHLYTDINIYYPLLFLFKNSLNWKKRKCFVVWLKIFVWHSLRIKWLTHNLLKSV